VVVETQTQTREFLKPGMGISFLDVNKQVRHGMVQQVTESHAHVYILYTKDILREVQANILSGARLTQFISSLEDHECLQSMYMDQVPLHDIQETVLLNYAQFSVRTMRCNSLLIVGWLYFGIRTQKSRMSSFLLQYHDGFTPAPEKLCRCYPSPSTQQYR